MKPGMAFNFNQRGFFFCAGQCHKQGSVLQHLAKAISWSIPLLKFSLTFLKEWALTFDLILSACGVATSRTLKFAHGAIGQFCQDWITTAKLIAGFFKLEYVLKNIFFKLCTSLAAVFKNLTVTLVPCCCKQLTEFWRSIESFYKATSLAVEWTYRIYGTMAEVLIFNLYLMGVTIFKLNDLLPRNKNVTKSTQEDVEDDGDRRQVFLDTQN